MRAQGWLASAGVAAINASSTPVQVGFMLGARIIPAHLFKD
jgi:hypothetical protein